MDVILQQLATAAVTPVVLAEFSYPYCFAFS
jgi:hypothetical protein